MRIVDAENNETLVRQMAEILLDGFSDTGTESWVTMAECLKEVKDSLDARKISRIGVDENEKVLAWTIGAEIYTDHTWELELLVVRRDSKEKGFGRKMLEDFEEQVLDRGGSVVFLGSDDENNRTSIGGIELYPNPLEHLSRIQNIGRHPFEFYQKCGYTITGVVPHANGFGKPDIWMCKQVKSP
jgi:aminoglycoside 6'-N-acetyltransferase I